MTQGIKENELDARVIYADIIGLPHYHVPGKEYMSPLGRASQFSSFNALEGYEDMVGEEAREVGQMVALSEAEIEILNQKMNLIADVLEDGYHPVLKFTYFLNDQKKVGGFYVTLTERVRKIDLINRKIQLYKKIGLSGSYMELAMDKISDISGNLVDFIG